MKVLLSSQHFWPENFRINQLAKELQGRGLDVHVLTGKPNYPTGKIFPGYSPWGISSETSAGIKILRVPIFPRGLKNRIRLTVNYLSFILSATVVGLWKYRKERFDVIFVYATSPLLQAIPALLIGRLKRIPVFLNVQDLWPDSLLATGYVRNRTILMIVRWIVRFIYTRSDVILISSRPFESVIREYKKNAEIIYFPNSADSSYLRLSTPRGVGGVVLKDKFNVVFAGNIGAAQAIDVIIEAAFILKDFINLEFVIVGDGSERSKLSDMVSKLKLKNVTLLGQFSSELMPNILSQASVLLVTLADRPIFEKTVPNKIQAYMAAGKPIVGALNGEGAKLISESQSGFASPAEDGMALAKSITKLYEMSASERDQLGKNGQQYFLSHFHEDLLTGRLIEIFTKFKGSGH